MSLQLLILIVALAYLLGALTGRWILRLCTRRGRRRGGVWSNYYRN
jgi:uncharacterized protein YneF (UPF0154 family)